MSQMFQVLFSVVLLGTYFVYRIKSNLYSTKPGKPRSIRTFSTSLGRLENRTFYCSHARKREDSVNLWLFYVNATYV